MMRSKKLLAVVGATALLAISAPAVSAQSGSDAYGGANVVAGLNKSSGGGGSSPAAPSHPAPKPAAKPASTPVQAPVQAASEEGASLPFTGADLGVLAAAGGILLGLGFGLRRLTHRPSH